MASDAAVINWLGRAVRELQGQVRKLEALDQRMDNVQRNVTETLAPKVQGQGRRLDALDHRLCRVQRNMTDTLAAGDELVAEGQAVRLRLAEMFPERGASSPALDQEEKTTGASTHMSFRDKIDFAKTQLAESEKIMANLATEGDPTSDQTKPISKRSVVAEVTEEEYERVIYGTIPPLKMYRMRRVKARLGTVEEEGRNQTEKKKGKFKVGDKVVSLINYADLRGRRTVKQGDQGKVASIEEWGGDTPKLRVDFDRVKELLMFENLIAPLTQDENGFENGFDVIEDEKEREEKWRTTRSKTHQRADELWRKKENNDGDDGRETKKHFRRMNSFFSEKGKDQ